MTYIQLSLDSWRPPPLLSNRNSCDLGPRDRSLSYQVRQPSVEIEGGSPMSVLVLVVVAHISAPRGSRCSWPELGLLAGDLTVTNPSPGMDIWIEWYPPERHTDLRNQE